MPTTLGELVVRIGGDISSLRKAYADTKRETQALAEGLGKAGDALTSKVTVPLLAAGAAALKFAGDFGQSFAEIQGLVGVAGDELSGFREDILSLGPEVRKVPTELAEALFFITSAGFEGAAALDALDASARASTAGLGTTASVADAVTSAVNAYGAANLAASEATDVLTATVREGKLEAASLAPQLGRLLPLAAELGVSFDQVGASLSVFSRSTGSAELSATQLTGILSKLIGPTESGRKALDALGLSAEDLRQSIRDRGLLETLVELREKVDAAGGNAGETFKLIFEEINAVNGVLQLTGDNADAARVIFDSLAGSAGATQTAFEAVADTFSGKLSGALASAQVLAVRVGEAYQRVLGPALETAGALAARAAEAFSRLSPATQETIVKVTLLAAAVGPLLGVLAAVVAALPFVAAGFAALGTTATAALGPIGLVAAALAALVLGYDAYTRSAREAVAQTGQLASASDRLGASLPTVGELAGRAATNVSALGDAFARARQIGNELGPRTMILVRDGIGEVLNASVAAHPGLSGLTARFAELRQQARIDLASVRTEFRQTAKAAVDAGREIAGFFSVLDLKPPPLETVTPPAPPAPPPFVPDPVQVATAAEAVRTVTDVTRELNAALAAARVRFEEGLISPAARAAEEARATETAFSALLSLDGGRGVAAARTLGDELRRTRDVAADLGLDEALAGVEARLTGGVVSGIEALADKLALVRAAYDTALESSRPQEAVDALRLRVLALRVAILDAGRVLELREEFETLLRNFNSAEAAADRLGRALRDASDVPLPALDETERATLSLIASAPRLAGILSSAFGTVRDAVEVATRAVNDLAAGLTDAVLAFGADLFSIDGERAALELAAFAEGAAETRAALQEAFEEGRIGAAELALSLRELEERSEAFSRSLPTVANAFRNLASAAKSAVTSIIADIARAIVRALVLKGILTALNFVSPAAGTALGGILSSGGGFATGGGVAGKTGQPQQVTIRFEGSGVDARGRLFFEPVAVAQSARAGEEAFTLGGAAGSGR